jgi:iron complex outermembrane receptor protein
VLSAHSQEKTAIRLLDRETGAPITDATYTYGALQGVSNPDGVIYLAYQEGTRLVLSHLNYGQWVLEGPEVLALMAEKVLYRSEIRVDLYPITVIALRPEQKPGTEMELDYRERLAHDAASILMQEPAIGGIRKGGNYGFDPVFRGFKYDQLNVVLNGAQGATAACPNRMDPPTSQMAPNMIDRIEILKGPHALRYGTGFGATLNFVPSRLRFSEAPDVYGRMSNGIEANGSVFRNEGQLGFSGENHDLSFFGSWSQGNDYTSGDGTQVQADFNRGSFGGNFGFKFSEDDQLRLSVIYNVARDADFPALSMDLREDDTWLMNARYDKAFNREHLASWNTTVFASFVNHLMDNRLKPLDPRMLNAETDATTYNYGGRTEGVWSFNNNTLYAGADFRGEGAEGTRVREFLMGPNQGMVARDNVWQDGYISKGGLFAEYQLVAKAWRYVVSTRVELNVSGINDPAPEFLAEYGDGGQTQLNPSVSLGATRSFGGGSTAGIWLARAQRSAGLAERFINYFPIGQDPYELLGNPNLDAEVNYQLDLTYAWKGKNTELGVDVFAGYLDEFISSVIDPDLTPRLPMSPGVRRFVNIDNAFKTGFELTWTQRLLPELQQQVGVAYTYAQDLERDEPLPEIAPMDLRYTLAGSFMKGKLTPELVFRHVLRQGRISTEFGETETPSFSLLDIRASYQVSEKARFTLGVNNLFDENYYEHLNRSVSGGILPIFAPGQNVFASLNLTL